MNASIELQRDRVPSPGRDNETAFAGVANPPRLRVTVLDTTTAATIAALRAAASLAAALRAGIVLVSAQVIPFAFTLENPPVPASFLENRLYEVVCAAGIDTADISIELWLCRSRVEAIATILPPHSLVVIGQTKCLWWVRKRYLQRLLLRLGHEVIVAGTGQGAKSIHPAVNIRAARLQPWLHETGERS